MPATATDVQPLSLYSVFLGAADTHSCVLQQVQDVLSPPSSVSLTMTTSSALAIFATSASLHGGRQCHLPIVGEWKCCSAHLSARMARLCFLPRVVRSLKDVFWHAPHCDDPYLAQSHAESRKSQSRQTLFLFFTSFDLYLCVKNPKIGRKGRRGETCEKIKKIFK
ncbi:hypothetical protein TRVL_04227 [Trypanosoma vivax]|nr:hypothetical protein TRVL_04227 [Trypanosoma vivax]